MLGDIGSALLESLISLTILSIGGVSLIKLNVALVNKMAKMHQASAIHMNKIDPLNHSACKAITIASNETIIRCKNTSKGTKSFIYYLK